MSIAVSCHLPKLPRTFVIGSTRGKDGAFAMMKYTEYLITKFKLISLITNQFKSLDMTLVARRNSNRTKETPYHGHRIIFSKSVYSNNQNIEKSQISTHHCKYVHWRLKTMKQKNTRQLRKYSIILYT